MPLKKQFLHSGSFAGILAVIFFVIFRSAPEMAEFVYGNGIYPIIRFTMDYTLGMLPFPAVFLSPFFIVFLVWRRFKSSSNRRAHLVAIANTLGWMVALFYLLWGYNYARPDLNHRNDVIDDRISNARLIQLGEYTADALNSLRATGIMQQIPEKKLIEQELRTAVEKAVAPYGFELFTQCRVRTIEPPGILRKLGITGIYFPYSGEGLVEASHPLPERIFVMAHELAHGFGVTDEGDANLVAYIACTNHTSPLVQYAGHLALWEYLIFHLKRNEIPGASALESELTPLVNSDIALLKAERRKFKEWVPRLGDIVNDSYLKVQGVEAGTDAYHTLPEQVIRHNVFPVSER